MIRWAVRRPAVIWAAVTVILLSGAISFSKLALATKTTVELPRLQVSAGWNGASAELMETFVTSPIEAAIQTVRGVRRVNSMSRENTLQLTVELQPNANVQMARLAILERLDLLRTEFPPGVTPPRVSNFVPEDLQEAPLFRVTLTGPYTPGALQKLVNEVVSPRLSAVDGVSGLQLRGGTELGASVTYDPSLLRQLRIPPEALTQAVQSARVVQALGAERLGASTREVVLRDQPEALEELEALPIRGRGGLVFRLGQLATVRPEEDSRGAFFRINGNPAIAFDVYRNAHADAIKTSQAVRAVMASLARLLPPGVGYKIGTDSSEDLAKELRDLMLRGSIAFGAVMLVLAVALRNAKAVTLVMGSAAVSIAGTALGLYLFDIPANLLTLAGLGMGIGILVQNGIIVVERLRSAPDTPEGRAAVGERMTPAVIGATLTTAVVLFPFLYLQGNARAAFVPFAAAFTIGMAWSVVASLVMVPSLAAGHGMAARWIRAKKFYAAILKRLIRWRYATMLLTAAALGVLTWGFTKKVRRFSWGGFGGPQRNYVNVSITFPRGSDPQSLDRAIREMESIAIGREGVEEVTTQGAIDRAQMRVTFTMEAGYTGIPLQVQDELTQRAVYVGGASIGVSGEGPAFYSGGGGLSGGNFRIKVLGYSYEGVLNLANDLKARLERIARVRTVNVNASSFFGLDRSFSVTLEPDRMALARHGLTSADLAAAIAREIRGPVGALRVEINGEEIPITVKAKGARDRSLDELRMAIVPTAAASPVKVSDLSTLGEREVPGSIQREDQQYVRIVSYEFRGPQKLAERTHKAFMGSISVPIGYSVADQGFGGFPQDRSEKGLWLVFGVGIALVVLVVALVFDSVWATVMVFLDLPIAFGGVMGAFWATGAAFTREAAVGVILVVGLAVSHSVLLVDAALERRRRQSGDLRPGTGRAFQRPLSGAEVLSAALERSGMIVLVTLTTLASLLPLAIGTRVDSLFGAIALATAGGTVAGTLGAMFVMPALLARWSVWRPRFYIVGWHPWR